MKKVLIILSLMTSISAQALIIKGEESRNHYIQVEKVPHSELYNFLECSVDNNNFSCEPFFPSSVKITQDMITSMSRQKMFDMGYAVGADVALLVVAWYAYEIAYVGSRFYYGAIKGMSVDGVGSMAGSMAVVTVSPTLAATPLIFDVLDPRTHHDLAQALQASTSSLSSYEMQNEYEGINMMANFESPMIVNQDNLTKKDHIVTINNLSTKDIVNSYKKLIIKEIIKLDISEEAKQKMMGFKYKTPVEKLLEKKTIGL